VLLTTRYGPLQSGPLDGIELSGVTLTTGAWTDVIPNQSFTVDDATAAIEIIIGGFIEVSTGGAASCVLGARAVIDSGGTPQNFRLGGDHPAAARWANGLNGTSPVVIFRRPVRGGPHGQDPAVDGPARHG
jgi:hypothetical protein